VNVAVEHHQLQKFPGNEHDDHHQPHTRSALGNNILENLSAADTIVNVDDDLTWLRTASASASRSTGEWCSMIMRMNVFWVINSNNCWCPMRGTRGSTRRGNNNKWRTRP
jgi:hypothetical protein